MVFTRLLPILLLCSAGTVACAGSSSDEPTASEDSHLDTSGCTGNYVDATRGPVAVHAERPPTKSCWNIQTGGLRVDYTWAQANDSTPSHPDLGFWVSLNGAGKFTKASSISCGPTAAPGVVFGPDTSGQQTYECKATVWVAYKDNPEMVNAGYDGNGRKNWDVAVAVALDSDNHWDSLNGANYHFGM